MGREARNRLLVLRSRAMAIFGDGEVLSSDVLLGDVCVGSALLRVYGL